MKNSGGARTALSRNNIFYGTPLLVFNYFVGGIIGGKVDIFYQMPLLCCLPSYSLGGWHNSANVLSTGSVKRL